MGVRITILGSGSAGNCTLIESDRTQILVDAGLSGRQIKLRLETIGRGLDRLDGVVLTHEHSDHTRGLAVLCKGREIPVYANRLTAESYKEAERNAKNGPLLWRLFITGESFAIGDLVIDSFSVPHDAHDPVGFLVRRGDQSVAVLTDLGHSTKLVTERVREADVLVVEANHDIRLLQEDTARPWATKQRIMSRHGHLSNDAAAGLAAAVATERLRHVFLAHLSRDCNRPELAHEVVCRQLGQRGAGHVKVTVASQDAASETVALA